MADNNEDKISRREAMTGILNIAGIAGAAVMGYTVKSELNQHPPHREGGQLAFGVDREKLLATMLTLSGKESQQVLQSIAKSETINELVVQKVVDEVVRARSNTLSR